MPLSVFFREKLNIGIIFYGNILFVIHIHSIPIFSYILKVVVCIESMNIKVWEQLSKTKLFLMQRRRNGNDRTSRSLVKMYTCAHAWSFIVMYPNKLKPIPN